MKTIARFPIGILVGASLILAAGLALNPMACDLRKLSPADYVQVLSALFFVALVLERALEVYVCILHAPEAETIQCELDQLQDALDFKDKERQHVTERAEAEIALYTGLLERCLATPGAAPGNHLEAAATEDWCRQNIEAAKAARSRRIRDIDEQAAGTLARHDQARQQRMERKIRTRLAVLKWSTVFGLLIGALGLRTLTTIIEPASIACMPVWQARLLTAADVALTGGLLAGGSEGIHKITQAVTSFLDAATAGNKDKTRN